ETVTRWTSPQAQGTSIGLVSAAGSVSTLRRFRVPVSLQPNEITQPYSGRSWRFGREGLMRPSCHGPRRIGKGSWTEVDDLQIQRQLGVCAAARRVPHLGLLAEDEEVGEVFEPTFGGERGEGVGDAFGPQRRRSVHQLEVEVGRVRVAGVAEQPERLADLDLPADLDHDAARDQVGIEG